MLAPITKRPDYVLEATGLGLQLTPAPHALKDLVDVS